MAYKESKLNSKDRGVLEVNWPHDFVNIKWKHIYPSILCLSANI